MLRFKHAFLWAHRLKSGLHGVILRPLRLLFVALSRLQINFHTHRFRGYFENTCEHNWLALQPPRAECLPQSPQQHQTWTTLVLVEISRFNVGTHLLCWRAIGKDAGPPPGSNLWPLCWGGLDIRIHTTNIRIPTCPPQREWIILSYCWICFALCLACHSDRCAKALVQLDLDILSCLIHLPVTVMELWCPAKRLNHRWSNLAPGYDGCVKERKCLCTALSEIQCFKATQEKKQQHIPYAMRLSHTNTPTEAVQVEQMLCDLVSILHL